MFLSKQKNKSYLKGFTLIELLVVIAVIGLLSAVIMTSVSSARKKSRDATRKQDMISIRNALELYASSNDFTYPSTGGIANWRGTCATYGSYSNTGAGGYIPNLAPTYIAVLPTDPNPSASNCYVYTSNGVGYKFLVLRTIEGVSCPPLPSSFGFYDPLRSPTQCTAGVYTVGTEAW